MAPQPNEVAAPFAKGVAVVVGPPERRPSHGAAAKVASFFIRNRPGGDGGG